MIDLYWTVIPVLLAHYFASHPDGEYNMWRSAVVVGLTWVWAVRLTHNYLRREKWQWGAREDWRFTDMAQQHGQNWWWVSFFGVYLIQQVNHNYYLFCFLFTKYYIMIHYNLHFIDIGIPIWSMYTSIHCPYAQQASQHMGCSCINRLHLWHYLRVYSGHPTLHICNQK